MLSSTPACLQMVHPVFVDARTGQILQAAGQPTMMTFHQVGWTGCSVSEGLGGVEVW
jgi:hypothetical protein